MRLDQSVTGNVLKHDFIAMFAVVEDEVKMFTWSFCRSKYGRRALAFLL